MLNMASELQMVSQVVFPVFALSQHVIRHAGTSYICVCVCEKLLRLLLTSCYQKLLSQTTGPHMAVCV